MAKSDYKKDIKILIKIVRKVGRKMCDKNTYEERHKKHLVIEFFYKAKPFWHPFPSTPGSYTSVKKNYSDVKRKLNGIGLSHPGLGVRMITGINEWDGILGDIHDLLDSVILDRDETSPSVHLYFDDVEKLHSIWTKPYKKKVSYVSKKGRRKGKEITYDRYYVFGRKLDPYGRVRDGFVSVRKNTFVEALIVWKQIRK